MPSMPQRNSFASINYSMPIYEGALSDQRSPPCDNCDICDIGGGRKP